MSSNEKGASAKAPQSDTVNPPSDCTTVEKLTILESLGLYLTKVYPAEGEMKSYDDAANFKIREVEVSDIVSLSAALTKLEEKANRCQIHGKFVGKDKAVPSKYPGAYPRNNQNFIDQPLHSFMLDIDKYKPDFGDPVEDPELCIDGYLRKVLPKEFWDVSYHWQLSSSAGQPSNLDTLKAHVWFWLETPRKCSELYEWAKIIGPQVDKVVYRRAQIRYTAGPIFEEGREDPVPVRSGLVRKGSDVLLLAIDEAALAQARDQGAGEGGNDMKLVDPSEKDNLVGIFHRTFTPEQVMLELLEGQFVEASQRRWTWLDGGGTPEGVWVHDDGMHIGSSHNTWPIAGIANLWDITRVFKFGHLDKSDDEFEQLNIDSAPIQAKPSNLAMIEWAKGLPELQTELAIAKTQKLGDLILFDIARLLSRCDDLEALGEELEFDHEKISQVFAAMAFNPINSKFWMMTPSFGVVLSKEDDISMMIGEHYGRFMNNVRAVVERAAAEFEEKPSWVTKTVKEIETRPFAYLIRKTKAYRQAMKIELEVDMFATTGCMRFRDGITTLVFSHTPFVVGDIDPVVIQDYKLHFPEFDDFILLLAVSRFASSRKKSHLWLNCESDWGKSFLMGALARLGLVVETSVSELEKMLAGGPVAKTIDEFKRVWCLAIDEFKGVTREVKQMSEYINFAPKGLASVQAPLYLKLFMSAESVDSLASKGSGIEDQFANRFLYVAGKGSLELRNLFMDSKRHYLGSLVAYIAQGLNEKVEYFRALGAEGAADAADDELVGLYEKYRIDRKFDRLSSNLEEIARSFAEDCAEAYAILKRHDRGTKFQHQAGPYVFETPSHGLCLHHPVTVINLWIEDTYGRSEGGKLNYKKDQIIEALGGGKTIAGFGKDRKKGVVLDIPVPVADVGDDFND